MLKNKLNYNLVNLLIIIIMMFLMVNTFNFWKTVILRAFSLILPFLIAFIIAYSLYPVVKWLKKLGINSKVATVIVIISVLSIIILMLFYTIPTVYNEMLKLPYIVDEIVNNISKKFLINLDELDKIINLLINKLLTNIGEYVSNGFISIVTTSVDIVTKIIITAIVSIYLLFDMEKIRKKGYKLLTKINIKVLNYIKLIDSELQNYLQGFLIFIIIQLFEYILIYKIINHPNWLLLALLASLTSVVPYFGGLLTNIVAIILASVCSTKLLYLTILICIIFPIIDGYIISPKVFNKTNDIDPVLSIFFVFISGVILGFFGILIALPIYIVLNTTYLYIRKNVIN